jgi:hypothetical protein
MVNQNIVFWLLLTLIVASGCRSIQPNDPEMAIDKVIAPQPEVSGLSIPIEINLKPYFKDIEKSVPSTFEGKESVCEGVSYQYQFKRNAIDFSSAGKHLRFAVNGLFWLKLSYCPKCVSLFEQEGNCITPRIPASCGVDEPMRRADVAFNTSIQLSSKYRLQSSTKLETFEVKDPCEITVFQYDATSKLKKEVTGALKGLEKEIDKQIASVDVKSSIESAWKSMNEPIIIPDYGFLYFQPLAMAVDPISFQENKALVKLHLRMSPVFSTSSMNTSALPLPDLQEFKEKNGFHVALDIRSGYDSLNSILNTTFSGQKFNFKKKEIVIDSLFIHSAVHNKINVKVHFSGDKKGVFFLTATPTYDAQKKILSLPDADFDLNSKHALLQTAKWMFHHTITDAIREKAIFDLTKPLMDAKKTLEKELNTEITKGVFLSGTAEELGITGIFPQEEELIIRIRTNGKLEIKM